MANCSRVPSIHTVGEACNGKGTILARFSPIVVNARFTNANLNPRGIFKPYSHSLRSLSPVECRINNLNWGITSRYVNIFILGYTGGDRALIQALSEPRSIFSISSKDRPFVSIMYRFVKRTDKSETTPKLVYTAERPNRCTNSRNRSPMAKLQTCSFTSNVNPMAVLASKEQLYEAHSQVYCK